MLVKCDSLIANLADIEDDYIFALSKKKVDCTETFDVCYKSEKELILNGMQKKTNILIQRA